MKYNLSVSGTDNRIYRINTDDREMAKEWLFRTFDMMKNDRTKRMEVIEFFTDGK